MKNLFTENKKLFASTEYPSVLDVKVLFAIFSVCTLLASCPSPKFAGRGDNVESRSTGVAISVKKTQPSSQGVDGTGELLVTANYPLTVTCQLCPLVFSEATLNNNSYEHKAHFTYGLVRNTEVCKLRIVVKSINNEKINKEKINKEKIYNLYVCPQEENGECKTEGATEHCGNINGS